MWLSPCSALCQRTSDCSAWCSFFAALRALSPAAAWPRTGTNTDTLQQLTLMTAPRRWWRQRWKSWVAWRAPVTQQGTGKRLSCLHLTVSGTLLNLVTLFDGGKFSSALLERFLLMIIRIVVKLINCQRELRLDLHIHNPV